MLRRYKVRKTPEVFLTSLIIGLLVKTSPGKTIESREIENEQLSTALTVGGVELSMCQEVAYFCKIGNALFAIFLIKSL